jgi:hypothetical protein
VILLALEFFANERGDRGILFSQEVRILLSHRQAQEINGVDRKR